MKSLFFTAVLVALVGSAWPLSRPAFAQTNAAPVTTTRTQVLPFLHPLFSDNAVLQRGRSIPIWGWTSPGGKVRVQIDKKHASATADQTGRWMVHIGPFQAGGPHTLSAMGSGSGENISRQNILFGDVWLCSGQSNMEMGLSMVNNGAQEIAAANYPDIRLFTVPKKVAAEPRPTVDSQWQVCTPANVAAGGWGGFSATAYFFGRKLHQELKVPIGLIHSSWGGTVAEAWVSESALGKMPDFPAQIALFKQAVANTNAPVEDQTDAWLIANDPGTKENWAAPNTDDKAWTDITAPGTWETAKIPAFVGYDGIVWYRREVTIPAEWAGHELKLIFGGIDDSDTTYWNGQEIAQGAGFVTPRNYTVPAAQVKAGRAIIAVRVVDNGGEGGMNGPADQMRLEYDATHSIPLTGPWKIKAGKQIVIRLDSGNPNVVTVLYNAMIAPLEPYGLKGAIWYQGESNAYRAEQYGRLLPTLIRDWRGRFETPLPFYIVQLAGFMGTDDVPRDGEWPQLRDAQLHTTQTVEHTGLAVTIDIGDQNDIHPHNKQDVGLRLALSALAKDYGRKVEYSGPAFKSAKRQGTNLIVSFTHAAGGLSLKGDANRVFAISGSDKKWFWATPQIEGNRIVLNVPQVIEPVAVRFGWSNTPNAFLYNGANLPASPFRSSP